MIKSKFSFLSVYFALAVICAGVVMAVSGVLILGAKQSSSLLIFGGLAVFAGYFLVKQMIVIKVYPDRIELRGLLFRQTIFRDDIRSIDLGGRTRSGFMSLKWPTSAIVIKWGRSEEIILSDTFYRNMQQVKQALYKNFVFDPGTAVDFPDDSPGMEPVPEAAEAGAVTFAGQPLLNIHTILFLVYVIMIAIALRPVRSDVGSAIYAGILVVLFIPMYIMVGTRLYYFRISDEYLIVKNHFFPWYTRGFKVKDIRDVAIEISLRRVIGLRIATRSFFSKRYLAGSLGKDSWKGLEQALRAKGVSVNNELPV